MSVKILECGGISSRIIYLWEFHGTVIAVTDSEIRLWKDFNLVKTLSVSGAVWAKWCNGLYLVKDRQLLKIDVESQEIIVVESFSKDYLCYDVADSSWLAATEKEILLSNGSSLKSHVPISLAKFNSNGIVYSDEMGRVNIWYPQENVNKTAFHWHSSSVSDFSVSENYLISGGREGVLVVWDCRTGQRSFIPRLGSGVKFVVSNDSMSAAVLDNNSVRIFSVAGLHMIQEIKGCLVNPKIMMTDPGRLKYLVVGDAKQLLWVNHRTGQVKMSLNVIEENIAGGYCLEKIAMSEKWLSTFETRVIQGFPLRHRLKIYVWKSNQFVLNTSIECSKINSMIIIEDRLITAGDKIHEYRFNGHFVNTRVIDQVAQLISFSFDNSVIAVANEKSLLFFDSEFKLIKSGYFFNPIEWMDWTCSKVLVVGDRKCVYWWDACSNSILRKKNCTIKDMIIKQDQVYILSEHNDASRVFVVSRNEEEIDFCKQTNALVLTENGIVLSSSDSIYVQDVGESETISVSNNNYKKIFGTSHKPIELSVKSNVVSNLLFEELDSSVIPGIDKLFQIFQKSFKSESIVEVAEPKSERKVETGNDTIWTPNEKIFKKLFKSILK